MDNTARKPKVGDMVTAGPFRVIDISPAGPIKLDMPRDGYVSQRHIASIEPRSLQAGDRVYINNVCTAPAEGWRVEFVSDRVVLSYNGNLATKTYRPSDLTRVEDKP